MSESEKPIHRLVLHPQNADYTPDSSETIRETLQKTGFIAEPCRLSDGQTASTDQDFLVGEQFLQMLTFMGCSPNINLAPQHEGDRDYCHIVLSPVYAQVHFRSHERDVFARCPKCGRRDANWPALIERWQRNSTLKKYVCPHCYESMSLYDLRWRQMAGFGRFFIDVLSIFPQEGIPTSQLMSALENVSAQPWTYFFSNR
ncbi:hypothetical protein MNBD_GAMMA24-2560 [hydrothermal vent metagenome]|uniref:Uncharacterized protein n=1 Tax=hydrothermal vent metagenome TaxID=652676 RepID=A0A3B1B4A6_9ZZZZ